MFICPNFRETLDRFSACDTVTRIYVCSSIVFTICSRGCGCDGGGKGGGVQVLKIF